MRLVQNQRQYASYRQILANQLVGDYESPSPTLVDVVMESRGWEDLITRVTNLRAIASENTRAVRSVMSARVAVTAEARRLARIEVRTAAGTNYSVGEEPIIAARLDSLGRAAQLHLIGISGYRTPAHSVEVGGFTDDPHTRGQASDTPGVEGVPEATLEEFCLTRPFGGAREADHIQEL